jgi:hypothetical protein
MLEFLKAYGFVIPGWVILLSLLGMDRFSPISCILQTVFLIFVKYYIHVVGHFPIFSKVYPHIFLHHDHVLNIPRWLDLIIESIYPFTTLISLHYFSKIVLQTHIFSTSIILAAAVLYNVVHILDYSIFGNAGHRQHHIQHTCNYEPVFMDVIFRTRCDNSSPYVNTNHQVIHAVMATSFVLILKLIFNLS